MVQGATALKRGSPHTDFGVAAVGGHVGVPPVEKRARVGDAEVDDVTDRKSLGSLQDGVVVVQARRGACHRWDGVGAWARGKQDRWAGVVGELALTGADDGDPTFWYR